jgi:hypothetical protein
MRKFFKEPLVHFIGLGLLLFVGNGLWERHVQKSDYTIVVEPGELERQALIFASENRRQPTDEDLQALLFAYVEEEALMREAERMGLGENDTIIRRRLAQKMRFLIEDTGAAAPPDDTELKAWFDDNQARFTQPETRSFKHVYLSPEKHGENLQTEANAVLTQINDGNWKAKGDPFMLQREYKLIDAKAAERIFGVKFAAGVFSLEGTQWSGPLESAFGLHMVQVDEIAPGKLPSFEATRTRIVTAWQEENRRATNIVRLKELISKYNVVVEDAE